ncbi:MAG: sugar phosphate isomerase/epimerase family protein [Eubacteriales bacterium]|nr:sugar phosphate isomerase/epimerase family protein [Eubacteriales bacterium]
MKHLLTIESYRAWESFGIDKGFQMIKEAGFDGLDLSFYWKAAPALCGDDYKEKALEIKNALAKHGLSCTQAHAPFDFLYGMKQDDSCFEYLSIKRAIEACGIIGIDHIVIHGVKVPAPACSRMNMEYNYNYYKTFEPLCKKFGVKIAVENLMASFTYPDLLNDILKQLDSPYFVGLVDVGHAWLRGGIQPAEFIRQMDKGTVKGLHIQDTHGMELGVDEHLVPYMANIDFEDLIKALKEYGYDGDFTMECPRFLEFYAKHNLLAPALTFAQAVGRKLVNELND